MVLIFVFKYVLKHKKIFVKILDESAIYGKCPFFIFGKESCFLGIFQIVVFWFGQKSNFHFVTDFFFVKIPAFFSFVNLYENDEQKQKMPKISIVKF